MDLLGNVLHGWLKKSGAHTLCFHSPVGEMKVAFLVLSCVALGIDDAGRARQFFLCSSMHLFSVFAFYLFVCVFALVE